MSSSKQTIPLIINRLTAMIGGFNKDLTAKQTLSVLGTVMTQVAILAELAADLQIVQDVVVAHETLASKTAAKKAAMPGITAFLAAIEQVLKNQFGPRDARLQDFGIKAPKSRKSLTAEQKTLAAATAKGTKKARGILGKRQRAAITQAGKPGLAMVDPKGGIVTGFVTGPTPPGSGTPVAVTGGSAPAAPESAPAEPSGSAEAPGAPNGESTPNDSGK